MQIKTTVRAGEGAHITTGGWQLLRRFALGIVLFRTRHSLRPRYHLGQRAPLDPEITDA